MASNENTENAAGPEEENAGEAKMLVSEFPPPPFYYKAAAHLTPPEIPHEALARGTKRAAANAARVRAESERLRLGEEDPDKTGAILGGSIPAPEEEEEGDVVAVFGEVVEDPIVEPLEPCEQPTVIRDEVKRLNKEVVRGFVKLVQELVHRPMDNKKMRDELSHNVFMMLLECNKFREHQAREFLIELLEQQLAERKSLIAQLQTSIARADELLGNTGTTDEKSSAKEETNTVAATPMKE